MFFGASRGREQKLGGARERLLEVVEGVTRDKVSAEARERARTTLVHEFEKAPLESSALGRSLGIAADNELLKRVKRTAPLRGMNPAERAKVLRGAFSLDTAHRHRVAGKSIILIDDVYTSGATADGCARMLKKRGAASEQLLCWARVIPDEQRGD